MWVKEQVTSLFITDKSPGIITACKETQAGTHSWRASRYSSSFGKESKHTSLLVSQISVLSPRLGDHKLEKLYSSLEYWPLILSIILDLKLQEPQWKTRNTTPKWATKEARNLSCQNQPALSGNSFFNYSAAHSWHGKASHYINLRGEGGREEEKHPEIKESDSSCQLG